MKKARLSEPGFLVAENGGLFSNPLGAELEKIHTLYLELDQ